MKIDRRPIMFINVLTKEAECNHRDWPIFASELRNGIIKNDLYPTGPVMFQVRKNHGKSVYTFHVPVNEKLEVEEKNGFSFQEQIVYPDGLLFRHSDSDESLEASYDLIRMAAKEYGFQLEEPFYNIFIPVYGDAIVDIYAPIKEEDE